MIVVSTTHPSSSLETGQVNFHIWTCWLPNLAGGSWWWKWRRWHSDASQNPSNVWSLGWIQHNWIWWYHLTWTTRHLFPKVWIYALAMPIIVLHAVVHHHILSYLQVWLAVQEKPEGWIFPLGNAGLWLRYGSIPHDIIVFLMNIFHMMGFTCFLIHYRASDNICGSQLDGWPWPTGTALHCAVHAR